MFELGLLETLLLNKAQCYDSVIRAVAKISSCRVNTTSRQGIKQQGISFGSIFYYFLLKVARGNNNNNNNNANNC